MKSKIVLVTGVAIGYVLGTRAGRGQYEKLRAQARSTWRDPKVQHQVSTAKAAVRDQAPVVGDKIIDVTKKAAGRATARSDGNLQDGGSGI